MRTKLAPLCPIDPRRDLSGFLAWHRGTFGDAVMTTPTPPAPPPAPPASSPAADSAKFTDPDTGESYDFPAQTPLAEMKPEQVAEYWRHKARKHEGIAKSRADYDDLKAKAAEADRLRQERESESEKAIREARETAEKEANLRAAPRLVAAEFRAAAKGVLTDEARDALLEDLDLTKFLTDKGEVDVEKVEKRVAALAPKKDEKRSTPGTGAQGSRDNSGKPSVASAREDYLESRRKKR